MKLGKCNQVKELINNDLMKDNVCWGLCISRQIIPKWEALTSDK